LEIGEEMAEKIREERWESRGEWPHIKYEAQAKHTGVHKTRRA